MWVVLALVLLGGIGAYTLVPAEAAAPEGAGVFEVALHLQTEGSESIPDCSSTDQSATVSDYRRPSPGSSTASDSTALFLWYDATSGRFGYTDETGVLVIEPLFDRAGQFREGLAPVRFQGDSGGPGYGYIDTTGALVIEPRFRQAFAFQGGLARVRVAVGDLLRYGYIDRSGAMVIEPRYPAAWDFSEGLARVALTDASGVPRYGFVDRTGALIIAPVFEEAKDFAQGLAAVAVDGRWGYIDRTGDLVIEPRFAYASSFMPWGQAEVDLELPGAPTGDEAPMEVDGQGFH